MIQDYSYGQKKFQSGVRLLAIGRGRIRERLEIAMHDLVVLRAQSHVPKKIRKNLMTFWLN